MTLQQNAKEGEKGMMCKVEGDPSPHLYHHAYGAYRSTYQSLRSPIMHLQAMCHVLPLLQPPVEKPESELMKR